MTASRILISMIAFVLVASSAILSAGPAPSDRKRGGDAPLPTPGEEIEVQFVDDSRMKLKLLDDKLELQTKHGTLKIAASDIKRIDFATRVPPDVAEAIASAVMRLGHADSQTRDRSMAELKTYRERAYPALVEATKGTDPEIVRRAEQLVRGIKAVVPAANLVQRETDIIHTEDSKIAGKLAVPSLRVKTFQFGEQVIKLTDLRSAGPHQAARIFEQAQPAPPSLMIYQGQFGKELTFSVTGAIQGTVWGTDVHTLDSSFPTAAVHAGKVQVGQTANVTIRIIQAPQAFNGTTRNGVTSSPYGQFPAGAYEFVE